MSGEAQMNELDNNTSQFENILSLDPEDLLQWLITIAQIMVLNCNL